MVNIINEVIKKSEKKECKNEGRRCKKSIKNS